MGRRKALLFTDVARLADYVRLGYPDAHAPARGYTLYQIPAPADPRRTLLLLLGHHPRRWRLLDRLATLFSGTPYDEIYEDVEVIEEHDAETAGPPARLRLIRGDQTSPSLPIRALRHSHQLVELIELVPATEAPPPGPVLFLAADPRLLGRLIVDSLALGNDRIRLTALGPQQILARIEQPSWFLIERFLEDEPGVTLFTPLPGSAERAWLPWGWQHPLAALWGQSEAAAHTDWLLFQPGQGRLRLTAPEWEDVYDVSDVPLDFASTAVQVVPAPVSTRFSVPVRLSPRARPAEAELWLAEATERPALEAMLRSLDEVDLNEILVAVVQPVGGGPSRYLLRERRTGDGGRRLLELDARGFAPWQGIVDLFLPADMALEPRLRRDRYRDMLQLGGGHLTLLVPRADGAPTEILRVPASAFVPLSELVDFLLTAEASQIEAVRARDLFAFGTYARAPSRPDLLQTTPARPARGAVPADAATPPPERAAAAPAQQRPTGPRAPSTRPGVVGAQLSSLQEVERELERELILSPDAARWMRLQDIKGTLGKTDEAVWCATEAAWLTEPRDEGEAHVRLQAALAAQLTLTGSATQRRRVLLQKAGLRSAVAYALHGRDLPEGQVAGWLETAERHLREQEGLLPKKLRWLAWGEVWRHNRDTRNQARIREQILRQLDADGVTNTDIPRFILERLLSDRSLVSDDEPSSPEASRALANLTTLLGALGHFAPPVQQGGLAAIAHAQAALGRIDLGRDVFDQAQQGLSDPLTIAWVTLLQADTVSRSDPAAAEGLRLRLQEQLAAIPPVFHSDLRARQAALAERHRDQSAETFLSTENIARLFPDISGARSPALDNELSQLQGLRRANKQRKFNEATERILERLQQDRVDPRALSRLLFLLVRELVAMEKLQKESPLPRMFELFAREFAKRTSDNDYFSVMTLLSLARGLAELKEPQATLRMLGRAMKQLAALSTDALDVIDAGSALLRVIELLPLDQRGSLLRGFFEVLNQQLHVLENSLTTPILLSTFDLLLQASEAAMSKDQLTLTRYRQYQDLDELLIRERILREDFCL